MTACGCDCLLLKFAAGKRDVLGKHDSQNTMYVKLLLTSTLGCVQSMIHDCTIPIYDSWDCIGLIGRWNLALNPDYDLTRFASKVVAFSLKKISPQHSRLHPLTHLRRSPSRQSFPVVG